MHRITILGKPDCHLCDVAADTVQRVIGAHVAAVIEKVDITTDAALLEKYRNDIPVVLIDGVEKFKHRVDPNELAALFDDEPGNRLLGIL